MIKIICCDIDGTLVRDDKTISEENIKWIRGTVKEKNVLFCLISGRMPSGIKQFHKIIGISGPVSCFNGCSFYDENGILYTDRRINEQTGKSVITLAEEMGLELILFDGNKWYLESKDGYIYPRKIKLYACEPEIGKMSVLINQFCPNKILTMSPDKEKLKEFGQRLKQNGLGEEAITTYTNQDFFEIMPPHISKADAIKDIRLHYGFKKEEIMAIGDDFNDEGMLKEAGTAVAMANSVPSLLKMATYITSSNNEDGVGKALEKFYHLFSDK